jgi:tetratricopeptide (TPR) repeat protein
MFDENYNSTPASEKQLLRFLEAGRRISGAPSSDKNPSLATNSLSSPPASPLSRSADCPPTESYLALATGTAVGEDAERLLEHASVCPACASILSGSLSALEGNPSQEETAAIAELAWAHSDWQRQIARELAATPAKKRPVLARPFFELHGRWLPGAAVAACVLLASGFWFWHRAQNNPEHQLALAYEESRTLELRVPDAAFTAMASRQRTRGAAGDDEAPSLLDARAQLKRELERAPQAPHWLELEARADILEERYNSAIDVLERLRAQGPASAELLSDLAMAYYQRGLVSGSEGDRSTALDNLRQADQLAPDDPVILFNEAIVMEDRGQMMNAVEVWTRYITVERDAKWKAEGQRKLAALEQTLNRLKSHESRMREMLATPKAMRALAADRQKLAMFDEELSSYQLDKLLLAAFPDRGAVAKSDGSQQSRGSPCPESCQAARTLLQAVGNSLILEHHDSWLTDLLTPYAPDGHGNVPSNSSDSFAAGMRLLAKAIAANLNGSPVEATRYSLDAARFIEQSGKELSGKEQSSKSGRMDAGWRLATHVAAVRITVEYLYALQRSVAFPTCRDLGAKFRRQPENRSDQARYPWMTAQELITEYLCDDTPDTLYASRALGVTARQITAQEHYLLLDARVNSMMSRDAYDSDDVETGERMVLPALRKLYTADPPQFRIFNTISLVGLLELKSPRSHSSALYLGESLKWAEAGGILFQIANARVAVACAELRNQEPAEAAKQLRQADEEFREEAIKTGAKSNLSEASGEVAAAMLEAGNLSEAKRYLDRGADDVAHTPDILLERKYAMAQGQLQLTLGHADQSVSILEKAIRLSEGAQVRKADIATSAESGQKDHDAYAELAAAWLAEGRSPESVLALWERFRLRSRGLPIAQCAGEALDCEQPQLLAREHSLGDNLLVGQIVLLDRILLYRVDRNGVSWTQKSIHRQNLLNAALALEQAVSSPNTSTETTAILGKQLTDQLLPALPPANNWRGMLLLEADPQVENLSWPVLPTPDGALGLTYPVAELQSILAPVRPAPGHAAEVTRPLTLDSDALVVGASVATASEPPLPEVVSEAEDVTRMLHAQAPLVGDRATAPRVAQALGSATIFHFAGHAVQTGKGTELLLAASSRGDTSPWIDGKFLRQHPPKICRLAVLSACSTGSQDAAWNHPLQNIVQTLGILGVPEVVATRWQIDSGATVTFMDAFYTNLEQGKSVALALMMARRVQSGQTIYRNPYYWGAYYVAGKETSHPIGELHAHFQENRQEQKN